MRCRGDTLLELHIVEAEVTSFKLFIPLHSAGLWSLVAELSACLSCISCQWIKILSSTCFLFTGGGHEDWCKGNEKGLQGRQTWSDWRTSVRSRFFFLLFSCLNHVLGKNDRVFFLFCFFTYIDFNISLLFPFKSIQPAVWQAYKNQQAAEIVVKQDNNKTCRKKHTAGELNKHSKAISSCV